MEKSRIGRCRFLIALVVIVPAGMVWVQVTEEMRAPVNERSAECCAVTTVDFRVEGDIAKQRPATDGMMVAENIRCGRSLHEDISFLSDKMSRPQRNSLQLKQMG
jgi:hypothetical protein